MRVDSIGDGIRAFVASRALLETFTTSPTPVSEAGIAAWRTIRSQAADQVRAGVDLLGPLMSEPLEPHLLQTLRFTDVADPSFRGIARDLVDALESTTLNGSEVGHRARADVAASGASDDATALAADLAAAANDVAQGTGARRSAGNARISALLDHPAARELAPAIPTEWPTASGNVDHTAFGRSPFAYSQSRVFPDRQMMPVDTDVLAGLIADHAARGTFGRAELVDDALRTMLETSDFATPSTVLDYVALGGTARPAALDQLHRGRAVELLASLADGRQWWGAGDRKIADDLLEAAGIDAAPVSRMLDRSRQLYPATVSNFTEWSQSRAIVRHLVGSSRPAIDETEAIARAVLPNPGDQLSVLDSIARLVDDSGAGPAHVRALDAAATDVDGYLEELARYRSTLDDETIARHAATLQQSLDRGVAGGSDTTELLRSLDHARTYPELLSDTKLLDAVARSTPSITDHSEILRWLGEVRTVLRSPAAADALGSTVDDALAHADVVESSVRATKLPEYAAIGRLTSTVQLVQSLRGPIAPNSVADVPSIVW